MEGSVWKLGLDFHHDVVLVQLREDGGDLALAEGVVEGVVDVGHGDAEAGRGVAVNDERCAQALILEVARNVGDDRLLAELLNHFAGVGGELGGVGVFERVLELGAADAVFDGQVLQRLEEELDAVDVGDLGLQAADDLGGGDLALVERLEGDLDAAGVERGVGAVDADEGGDVVDSGILQNDVDEPLLPLGHIGEADGLRRFADAEDHAGVLHREEALGHDDEEQDGGRRTWRW